LIAAEISSPNSSLQRALSSSGERRVPVGHQTAQITTNAEATNVENSL